VSRSCGGGGPSSRELGSASSWLKRGGWARSGAGVWAVLEARWPVAQGGGWGRAGLVVTGGGRGDGEGVGGLCVGVEWLWGRKREKNGSVMRKIVRRDGSRGGNRWGGGVVVIQDVRGVTYCFVVRVGVWRLAGFSIGCAGKKDGWLTRAVGLPGQPRVRVGQGP